VEDAEVEYWGVDWDFDGVFAEGWFAHRDRYRTPLPTRSPWVPFARIGRTICVRTFDVRGNAILSTHPFHHPEHKGDDVRDAIR
jgi:hypothetical protein